MEWDMNGAPKEVFQLDSAKTLRYFGDLVMPL